MHEDDFDIDPLQRTSPQGPSPASNITVTTGLLGSHEGMPVEGSLVDRQLGPGSHRSTQPWLYSQGMLSMMCPGSPGFSA